MKNIILIVALIFSSLNISYAGPWADDLGQCLVRSTSEQDRIILVTWIYAAISRHGELEEFSGITGAQSRQTSQEVAYIFTRLVTNDCEQEAIDAIQYEGEIAFETAFALLGEIAMVGIMEDQNVNSYMEQFVEFLDEDDFEF